MSSCNVWLYIVDNLMALNSSVEYNIDEGNSIERYRMIQSLLWFAKIF